MSNVKTIALAVLFLAACKQPTPHSTSKKTVVVNTPPPKITVDTGNSFSINGHKVTPKRNLIFNLINKTGADTIDIVACNDFVYSPFGNIKDPSAFNSGLLKSFAVQTKAHKMGPAIFPFQTLTHGKSKLLFFFDNNTEGSRRSNILQGEIYDADIQFINGIRVGMDIADFYKAFFDSFPTEFNHQYHVVKLTPCVDDIVHTYTFSNGKLKSIRFKTDTFWDLEY